MFVFLSVQSLKKELEIRMMKTKDYEKMGVTLFHQFHNHTGKEIGYHMSQNFKKMVGITDECLKCL